MSNEVRTQVSTSCLALFCDDIREEVSGKFTLVGIYGSDLIVSEFPVFIPKLAVSIRCSFPLDMELQAITFRIQRNDEILVESSAPVVFAGAKTESRPKEQDGPTRKGLNVNFMLPPMHFAAPCTLKAVAECNGVMYEAGKLHISSEEWAKAVRAALESSKKAA